MNNIKRWILCAFLFLVCLYILKLLNVKSEGYRGCRGCGARGSGRGRGIGMWSIPRYYGGYSQLGYPMYYYNDIDYFDYYYPESQWYIYRPFSTYYY